MIGIICAMPEEFEGFLDGAQVSGSSPDGIVCIEIGGHDAVIANARPGKAQAAMTATALLERFSCKGLVSAGTAGGLAGVEPYEVVVGTELIQHDYGRSRETGSIELYKPGVPPLPEYLSDDFSLRLPEEKLRSFQSVRDLPDFVRYGTYASGDTFVNDEKTRTRLIGLGAIAVDMECAAIAQVAEYYRVPWLVAKGISDSASNQSHEEFLEGLAEATRRSAEIVAMLLPRMLD